MVRTREGYELAAGLKSHRHPARPLPLLAKKEICQRKNGIARDAASGKRGGRRGLTAMQKRQVETKETEETKKRRRDQ